MSVLPPELAAKLVEAAREQYAEGSDDSIEIDDDAKFSMSEHDPAEAEPVMGCWVSAWVWVRADDCIECGETALLGESLCQGCLDHHKSRRDA